MKLKVGIQGDKCSTNEKAFYKFAEKYQWELCDVEYCISTEKVLFAIENNRIDYGIFAWESSRSGLVQETQEAIKRHSYIKIDEVNIQIDHALISRSKINKHKLVRIYSHDQALKEHRSFLKNEFPLLMLINENDTATAAKKLQTNKYPYNSIIIAPLGCAKTYGLEVFMEHLPTNHGYKTTFYLVKKYFLAVP